MDRLSKSRGAIVIQPCHRDRGRHGDASSATATAGAQRHAAVRVSGVTSHSSSKPTQTQWSRRAISSTRVRPIPAETIVVVEGNAPADNTRLAASHIVRVCASANQRATDVQVSSVPSDASLPSTRASRARDASMVFGRPSAVGIKSAFSGNVPRMR